MLAVKKDLPISAPVYSLQSERFHWQWHIDRIKQDFSSQTYHGSKGSVFAVLKDTIHASFSDYPMLAPRYVFCARAPPNTNKHAHTLAYMQTHPDIHANTHTLTYTQTHTHTHRHTP